MAITSTISGKWAVPPASSPESGCGVITARPTDKLFFAFDFGSLPQIEAGASISTAVVSATGLTLTSPQQNSYQCGARFTGGTVDTDYNVLAEVELSDGTVLNPIGIYRVK